MANFTDSFDAKALARKCPRAHICIDQADAVLCAIDYCVNNKVLFVKKDDDNFCPYRNNFGYSHFCTCPVRLQIYLDTKKN